MPRIGAWGLIAITTMSSRRGSLGQKKRFGRIKLLVLENMQLWEVAALGAAGDGIIEAKVPGATQEGDGGVKLPLRVIVCQQLVLFFPLPDGAIRHNPPPLAQ